MESGSRGKGISFVVALALLAGSVGVACGGSVDDGKSTKPGTQLDGGGPCQPGDKMPGDTCDACSCVSGQWACIFKACPPEPACKDGDQKKESCNTCTCSGGVWGCTKIGCLPQCTAGETKNDDCNACSCVDGSWACTDKACPPAECKEGETTNDGCNTCKCAGGSWACTLRYCPPALDAGSPKPGVGCGARLGDTCGPNEYCAYEVGQLCGAADASSVCKPRPGACDEIYAPVCGCDRKPYGNSCEAASAGTGVLVRGDCPPSL